MFPSMDWPPSDAPKERPRSGAIAPKEAPRPLSENLPAAAVAVVAPKPECAASWSRVLEATWLAMVCERVTPALAPVAPAAASDGPKDEEEAGALPPRPRNRPMVPAIPPPDDDEPLDDDDPPRPNNFPIPPNSEPSRLPPDEACAPAAEVPPGGNMASSNRWKTRFSSWATIDFSNSPRKVSFP